MIKLTFLGDIMCKREQLAALKKTSRTFDDMFVGIKELVADSDYVIGNLETPLAGENARYSYKPADFNTPDEFAFALNRMGVDFVTTANNHCLDRGVAGLERTLKVLDKAGLKHTGTYCDPKEAEHISIVDLNGVKIALVASTYGTNSEHGRDLLKDDELWRIDMLKRQDPLRQSFKTSRFVKLKVRMISALPSRIVNPLLVLKNGLPKESPRDFIVDNVSPAAIREHRNQDQLAVHLDKIAKAKNMADVVVALPHVGGQYNPYPGLYERYVVDKLVASGANAVIANHSHNPLEFLTTKKGVPVAFSLGNFSCTPFVDWYVYGSLGDYSIVLNLYLDETTKSFTKKTFSIVKNVCEKDGFTYTIHAGDYLASVSDENVKERVEVEMRAVSLRFCGMPISDLFAKEFEIKGGFCD